MNDSKKFSSQSGVGMNDGRASKHLRHEEKLLWFELGVLGQGMKQVSKRMGQGILIAVNDTVKEA